MISNRILFIFLSFCSLSAHSGILSAADRELTGRQLFSHRWTPEEGLGPLHNEKSCVACHFQGGIGGGGPRAANVELLSIDVPTGLTDHQKNSFLLRVGKAHPQFSSHQRNIVLHKMSIHDEYAEWRFGVLGISLVTQLNDSARLRTLQNAERRRRGSAVVARFENHGVPLLMSERNTPALFGAGQIDSVSDRLLQQIASRQEGSAAGISGRFSGKFGWRGQTRTLREFVLGACANELGMQTSTHRQVADPQNPKFQPVGDDLNRAQCDRLVEFVATLPMPRRFLPTDAQQKALMINGFGLFESIGCADCHVQNLDDLQDVFSDLLLHDMGPDLADPVAATPEQRFTGQVQTAGVGYFGGGSIDVFEDIDSNITQEWKTPPLWGCADSSPYLHDGRATTLHDAIVAHSGESLQSRNRYLSLDAQARQGILNFLQTLRGPDANELRRQPF